MADRVWKCEHCLGRLGQRGHSRAMPLLFKSPLEFVHHLREFHVSREGGSFVCRFGPNGICHSLPIEGVSDRDYEEHILKHHVHATGPRRIHAGSAVSSVPIPASARTYHEIREQQMTANARVPSGHVTGHAGADRASGGTGTRWNVYHSVVNLPAVLNDPKHRQTDIFSRTWGDSFERADVPPSPYLPNLSRKHFEQYVKKVHGRRQKRAGVGSSLDMDSEPSPHNVVYDSLNSQAELDVIPKYFFNSSFSLESPSTFATVLPWDSLQSRGAWAQVQERLTHYLDLVEVNIARQVSRKSAAFFQALSSQDALREKLANSLAQTLRMREKLRTIDEVVVDKHAKVLKLAKQRENYEKLYSKLKLVLTVHAAQPTIQTLLSTSDFCGALDLIAATQEILEQELAGIHCFRHLAAQLAEMASFVDKMVQAEFGQAVRVHLSSEGGPAEDEDQLVPCLLGMLRIGKLSFVDVYRREANQRIKDCVKSAVLNAVSRYHGATGDSASSGGGVTQNGEMEEGSLVDVENMSLANQMRRLDFAPWMQLFSELCTNLSSLLNRIQCGCEVLSNTCQRYSTSMADGQNSSSEVRLPADQLQSLLLDIRQMLADLCGVAQERLAKVIQARSRDGFIERLNSKEFVQLCSVAEAFQTDVCAKGNASIIRSTLQSQASRYVSRFHEKRKTKLSLILDNERWRAADVPNNFQELVEHITDSQSPRQRRRFAAHSKQSSNSLTIPEGATGVDSNPAAGTLQALDVNGERFVVVGTVLLLLKMVVEYCESATDMPLAAADLLTRLIELLKLFNSRTCQLVLGAGALQLVGLKTITSKNLALASRCLQLVLGFLPRVRRHFAPLLTDPRPMKHLDQVEKDYRDHVTEITNKLVNIMDGKLAVVLAEWQVKPPVPSPEIRTVSRQITKLHEAIGDVLPREQDTELFLRIHNCVKIHLRHRLREQAVVNDNGPKHGLVVSDLAFYMENLHGLSCLEQYEDDFYDLWR